MWQFLEYFLPFLFPDRPSWRMSMKARSQWHLKTSEWFHTSPTHKCECQWSDSHGCLANVSFFLPSLVPAGSRSVRSPSRTCVSLLPRAPARRLTRTTRSRWVPGHSASFQTCHRALWGPEAESCSCISGKKLKQMANILSGGATGGS